MRVLLLVCLLCLAAGCGGGVAFHGMASCFVVGDAQCSTQSTGDEVPVEEVTEAELGRDNVVLELAEAEPAVVDEDDQVQLTITGGNLGTSAAGVLKSAFDAALTVMGRTVGGN